MTKEQQKDKIIEIVKKAIDDNSVTSYGEDDIVSIDGDDVDHIAEEVAETICDIYTPIDNEPVGAKGHDGNTWASRKMEEQIKQMEAELKIINARYWLHLSEREIGMMSFDLYGAGYRKGYVFARETAKRISDWIAFRAYHGGYAEPVQNVLSELSDLIKRNYGVEVEE